MKYEVIVGNIGCVYKGGDFNTADEKYKEYARRSESGKGKAAFEEVTFLANGGLQNHFDPCSVFYHSPFPNIIEDWKQAHADDKQLECQRAEDHFFYYAGFRKISVKLAHYFWSKKLEA